MSENVGVFKSNNGEPVPEIRQVKKEPLKKYAKGCKSKNLRGASVLK